MYGFILENAFVFPFLGLLQKPLETIKKPFENHDLFSNSRLWQGLLKKFVKKTKELLLKKASLVYDMCFSKIGVYTIYIYIPPNHLLLKNRGVLYHDFHHPFLGVPSTLLDPRLAPLTIEVTMILPVPSAWGGGGLSGVHVPKQFSSRQFLCVKFVKV